ncbi:MAG: shikimate dehydrogenase [Deferribacterales bacterium]
MYSNYGLIGKPLSHSLSPIIHNYFINITSINGGYCCFEIDHTQIKDIVGIFKMFNFKGFNVTLPYKQVIMDYLDDIDEIAKKISAVNTVRIDCGRLIGYNTDINGIDETFKYYNVEINNKEILIIGAGGGCRGLLQYLKNFNYKSLSLMNRDVDKARILVSEIGIKNIDIIDINSFDNCKKYDIIINTTSAGLTGESYIEFSALNSEVAFDMQYSLTGSTYFLDRVKSFVKIDGLLMLIGQAYHAFMIWNNIRFTLDYSNLLKRLRGIR